MFILITSSHNRFRGSSVSWYELALLGAPEFSADSPSCFWDPLHITLVPYVLPRALPVAVRFHEVFGKVPLLTHLPTSLSSHLGGRRWGSALHTCKAGALSGKAACQSSHDGYGCTFYIEIFTSICFGLRKNSLIAFPKELMSYSVLLFNNSWFPSWT